LSDCWPTFAHSRRSFLASAVPLAITPKSFAGKNALLVKSRSNDLSGAIRDIPSHRDISLSDWGPYSDHWNGIAHIADRIRGLRADFALVPAILRRETLLPHAEMGLAMQPLRADPALGYIAWEYRLDAGVQILLEWFSAGADGGKLTATALNRSQSTWPVVLNWVARLAPPSNPPRTRLEDASGIVHRAQKGAPLASARVVLPPGGLWIDAIDHYSIAWARSRFDDHLVTDGRRRGEIFDNGFVGSCGIGQGFGADRGDRIAWQLRTVRPYHNAQVVVRYRIASGICSLAVSGLASGELALTREGGRAHDFRIATLRGGPLRAGKHALTLVALGGMPIEIDGFALVEADEADRVAFPAQEWHLTPERGDNHAAGETVLAWPDEIGHRYALGWTGGTMQLEGVRTNDLHAIAPAFNDPSLFRMGRVPKSDGPGHVTIATPATFVLAPGETMVRHLFVACGNGATVRANLAHARTATEGAIAAHHGVTPPTEGGKPGYAESAERLLATSATNMLFPIWTGGRWMRNYCPGREWSSVYTWDSGFTGLGLARAAPRQSIALLDTYLSPVGDDEAAFLHHGTPLATQFYQFQELWNASGDLAFARDRYPRLARYLRFLLGRVGGSTCRDLKSGLIRTYDYFYNTGGMDDYPAQLAVHSAKATGRVAPAISTAHAVRCARILAQVATAIGAGDDLDEWEADIASLGDALQRHAWDEEAGYFAYVEHDDALRPVGHWRSPTGENFNMGLDGTSPLVADVCTPTQRARLIEHLMTPGHLWTPYGITAVDQRASYYDPNGYWNGTVWMPHQWFMWKALLDYGEGPHAWTIAKTALDVYSTEVARSGRAYENFDARTGIGSAWHPFSALASPIRNWFEAYFLPRTLTVGLNTRVVRQRWRGGALRASLDISGGHNAAVLAVLGRVPKRATWRGRPVSITARENHCAEVILTPGAGLLEID
jgi:hypothetical protein